MTGPVEPDPLHDSAPTTAAWTTVNISEAFPGVPTPLSWSFFSRALDYCFPSAFTDLGVLARSERTAAASLDRRWSAIFHGRPALNLDLFRAMGDRSPGSSGDAVEEQMFGSVQTTGRPVDRRYDRWPVMAVKGPRTVRALPGRVRAAAASSESWWRAGTGAPPPDADSAVALFAEAADRMQEAFRLQLVTAMVAQSIFDQVQRRAATVGEPGLRDHLLTGYGSLTETVLLTDLWQVSRDQLPFEEFLAVHGYHGPAEGELSSRSWREDPADLLHTVEAFRSRDESPTHRLRLRSAKRREAERVLLARTPRLHRPATRLVLRLARTYLPFREDTKSAFLRIVDVARAAARSLGEHVVSAGDAAHPDDIFQLTVDELLGEPGSRPWHLVQSRRDLRKQHEAARLPDVWVGAPEPMPVDVDPTGSSLTGLPVSPGVVEGTARVVTDPDQRDDLEPGEILVCHTTDPSWTALFFLAAGLVIDVGGPVSHGAIVARELGVPCVINTRTGTRLIRSGDRLRVDGTTGTVEITRTDPRRGTPT